MDFGFARHPVGSGLGAFEIKSGCELLAGLVECVIHLLVIHFGDDIERRHGWYFGVRD